MEYVVVYSDDIDKLTEEVNNHIKEGWMPQGGIAITSHYSEYLEENTFTLAQAMVKNT